MFNRFTIACLGAIAHPSLAALHVYEPQVPFAAIGKDWQSRYNLIGTYGTNDIGWWDMYNFVYLEINGAPIIEDSVVSVWATFQKPASPENNIPTETVECVMIYRQAPVGLGGVECRGETQYEWNALQWEGTACVDAPWATPCGCQYCTECGSIVS